ncbi:hypothetical protein [Rufibacter ruber]|uniref:hypothetical protein n=1 Tax=Rufibacter ruber TaxID=1783499 RepID=UPI00083783F6|nr:hypothetical protein [Rufibacter ruber]
MTAKDFILDDDGDLYISPEGDFVIGESDHQHQKDIVQAFKGHYKEFPFIGVGILQYLKANGMEAEMKKAIKLELESDGYRVNAVEIIDLDKNEIYIDATRNI